MSRATKNLLPTSPSRLVGSCWINGVVPSTPHQAVENLLSRAAETSDPAERMMQAQRAIGAFMAFNCTQAKGLRSYGYQVDFFARLAEITGKTPGELCACAGVARGARGGAA